MRLQRCRALQQNMQQQVRRSLQSAYSVRVSRLRVACTAAPAECQQHGGIGAAVEATDRSALCSKMATERCRGQATGCVVAHSIKTLTHSQAALLDPAARNTAADNTSLCCS